MECAVLQRGASEVPMSNRSLAAAGALALMVGVACLAGACAPPPLPPTDSADADMTKKPSKSSTSPGGGNDDDHGDDHAAGGEVGVFPTEVHTGFDGEHDFVVPVSSLGGAATWTGDDDAVSLETSDEGVMITPKKAGPTTVTAKIGGKKFTVEVDVTEYDASAWTTGQRVYNETIKCKSCHVKSSGPDHSPTEIGKHEDAHLEKRVLTGESLHGEPAQANHKFESRLATGELEGVLAYLRGLTPRGWPKEEHGHEHEEE
jgi:hypothetical protein